MWKVCSHRIFGLHFSVVDPVNCVGAIPWLGAFFIVGFRKWRSFAVSCRSWCQWRGDASANYLEVCYFPFLSSPVLSFLVLFRPIPWPSALIIFKFAIGGPLPQLFIQHRRTGDACTNFWGIIFSTSTFCKLYRVTYFLCLCCIFRAATWGNYEVRMIAHNKLSVVCLSTENEVRDLLHINLTGFDDSS